MSVKRQIVYAGGPTLRARLNAGDVEQLQQYAHLFKPVIEWLRDRSAYLQASEDAKGSFDENCPAHLHVRAMKGARMDCDDVRQELSEIVNPNRM